MKRKLHMAAKPAAAVATVGTVASNHLGLLHGFLHLLDFAASWRVILELAGAASEILAVRFLGLAILSLSVGSLGVWAVCGRIDNRRQDRREDSELSGLHEG